MSTWLRLGRAAMALAIVVGIVAQFNYSSDRTAFSATNFFSYFTILSNIIAAVALAIVAARPAVCDDVVLGHVLRGAATLYMTVTGIVYATLLAPARGAATWTSPELYDSRSSAGWFLIHPPHHGLGGIPPTAPSGRDLFQQLKRIPPRPCLATCHACDGNPASVATGGV